MDVVVLSAGEVHLHMDTLVQLDPSMDVVMGSCRGQDARFIARRDIEDYRRAGIDFRTLPMNEALLRINHQSARHVRTVGVYHAGEEHGNMSFLVEAPYDYTSLEDHLASGADVGRKALFRQAVEIVADLHVKGLVLGSVLIKDFVVDPEGHLILSNFEYMRRTTPDMSAFRPVLNPSTHALASMAPELLDSFRNNESATLTPATDVYALGFFGYELFAGTTPLAVSGGRMHMAQTRLIMRIVDRGERPERPAANSAAFTVFGLTDGIWRVIEECWRAEPGSRPSTQGLHLRII